jgi:thiol-disulfide isomerase/thioredoxin
MLDATILQVSSAKELKKHLSKGKFTVVKFSTNECPPCRKIKPTFDKIASSKDYAGMTFIDANVADDRSILDKFSVKALPTIVIYMGGEPVDELVGAHSDKEIREFIDNNITT